MPIGNATLSSRRRSAWWRRGRMRRTTRRRRFKAERQVTFGLELQRVSRHLSLPPVGAPQWISLALVGVTLAVLIYMGTSIRFYVYEDTVSIEGNRYVDQETIYRFAGIHAYHVLFLHPAEIAQRVESLPNVRRASVQLGFPASVRIRVQERVPVLVWERGTSRYWVDGEGVLMPIKAEIPDLAWVFDPERAAGVEEEGWVKFDPHLLEAVLQVRALMPEVSRLYYQRTNGLWLYVGETQVILGNGSGVVERVFLLRRLLDSMAAEGEQYRLIDVRDPERVVLRR